MSTYRAQEIYFPLVVKATIRSMRGKKCFWDVLHPPHVVAHLFDCANSAANDTTRSFLQVAIVVFPDWMVPRWLQTSCGSLQALSSGLQNLFPATSLCQQMSSKVGLISITQPRQRLLCSIAIRCDTLACGHDTRSGSSADKMGSFAGILRGKMTSSTRPLWRESIWP